LSSRLGRDSVIIRVLSVHLLISARNIFLLAMPPTDGAAWVAGQAAQQSNLAGYNRGMARSFRWGQQLRCEAGSADYLVTGD
jgi:hypothetical protein